MEKSQEKVLYKTEDTAIKVDVVLKDEDIWLTQKSMAELFDTSVANINIHIKNIYEANELEEKRTIKENLIVQNEGAREVTRQVLLYSLDVIIAVGYRINSKRASDFRMWAMQVLRNHIVQKMIAKEKSIFHQKEFIFFLCGMIVGIWMVRIAFGV